MKASPRPSPKRRTDALEQEFERLSHDGSAGPEPEDLPQIVKRMKRKLYAAKPRRRKSKPLRSYAGKFPLRPARSHRARKLLKKHS